MEVKVSEGRNIKNKDPVASKQGVFACIEKQQLSVVEQQRSSEQELKASLLKKKEKEKVWTLSAIAERLSVWLKLKKPKS
jgi:hypothetical protein